MLIVGGEDAKEVLRQVKIRIVVNQFLGVDVAVGNKPIPFLLNDEGVRFRMFVSFWA